MYGLMRHAARQGKLVKSLQQIQKANKHQQATYGPPRVRISIAEKFAVAIIMSVCVVAPASYITYQLPSYRGEGEN